MRSFKLTFKCVSGDGDCITLTLVKGGIDAAKVGEHGRDDLRRLVVKPESFTLTSIEER
jgi:hypothetical protein